MFRRLLATTACAALLLGAAPAFANDEAPALEQPDLNPDYGPWGVALAELDQAANPGDDFFAFASGKWAVRTGRALALLMC